MLCIGKEGEKSLLRYFSLVSLNKLLNEIFQDVLPSFLCWLLGLGKSLVSQTCVGCRISQAGQETAHVSVVDCSLDEAEP